MKKNISVFYAFLAICVLFGSCKYPEPRTVIQFNKEWRFHPGDIREAMLNRFGPKLGEKNMNALARAYNELTIKE